jgi:hypothetical protein
VNFSNFLTDRFRTTKRPVDGRGVVKINPGQYCSPVEVHFTSDSSIFFASPFPSPLWDRSTAKSRIQGKLFCFHFLRQLRTKSLHVTGSTVASIDQAILIRPMTCEPYCSTKKCRNKIHGRYRAHKKGGTTPRPIVDARRNGILRESKNLFSHTSRINAELDLAGDGMENTTRRKLKLPIDGRRPQKIKLDFEFFLRTTHRTACAKIRSN